MSMSGTYFAVLSLASLLCNFDDFPSEQEAEFKQTTVSGIYTGGFEVHSFKPCGSKENWWLADRGINDRYAVRSATKPETYWRIQIRALVSPLRQYGHLGGYARCVTKVEFLSAVESQTNECHK